MSADLPAAQCASYTATARLAAVGLVGAVLAGGLDAAPELRAGADGATLFVLAIALAGLVAGLVSILVARTTLTASHLVQRGLWSRRVALAEITQVKLVQVPGLDWLVAPRLLVKARGRGTQAFHAADPALLRAVLARNGFGPRA